MSDAPPGRVALVTGGSRGIGRAISLALARDGYDLVINFRRDQEAAEQAGEAVERLGRRCVLIRQTAETIEGAREIGDSALSAFGRVNALVLCGGIASRGQSVADTDPEEPERVIRSHAIGPHHLCQVLVPGMRKLGRADIVFISSAATQYLPANGAPYAMAKAAMEALAVTLSREERKHGIRVNIVAPGLVNTEMGRRLVRATHQEDIHALDPTMPFGRVCEPEDVANVVRWLVSNSASYLTGERIKVDAGGPE